MRIQIQFRIQGFYDQKWKKSFFDKKLQFTFPMAFIKDAQATGETFIPQKRTSSTSKHEISLLFLLLWVNFALLDPEPDPDPAPQIITEPCGSASETLFTVQVESIRVYTTYLVVLRVATLNSFLNHLCFLAALSRSGYIVYFHALALDL